jgi:hypothetical protein
MKTQRRSGRILFLLAVVLCIQLPVFAQFSGGDGTPSNPFQITTLAQLDSVRYFLNNHFELKNDIDAAATKTWHPLVQKGAWTANTEYKSYEMVQYNNGAGLSNYYCINPHISGTTFGTSNWMKTILNAGEYLGFEPIGYSPNPLNLTIPSTTPFTGSFNGNYNKISNLFIYRIEEHNNGLFGYVYNINTVIKNIVILNATLYNIWQGGLLVGWNRLGTIRNCYSTGLATTHSSIGGAMMGGLVGRNGYTESGAYIYNSFSTADVIGIQGLPSTYIGGLVGANNGTISNSYARGNVVGNYRVGGLSGANYGASIINSYSTGNITANSEKGGLVGAFTYTVTNSYWDKQTSLITTSAGGTGKNTADMIHPYTTGTYTNWDFVNTWASDTDKTKNDGYPYLISTPVLQGLDNTNYNDIRLSPSISKGNFNVVSSTPITGIVVFNVLGKPVDFRITTNSNNSLTLSVSNNYQGLLLINATNGTGNQLLKGLVVK